MSKPLRRVTERFLLPALCCLLFGGTAGAEEWNFERLALESAKSHPSVEARRMGEVGAAADVESAKWQRFPVPAVQASQDTKGSNGLVFSLQQPLWTGGRISSGIDAANARQLASKEATRSSQQDVLSKVIDNYVESGLKQRQLVILDKSISQHENLFGMITRRVERQFSPQADLELASSRLRAAQNDKSFAAQALQIALAQLSELSGGEVTSVASSQDTIHRNLPESRDAAVKQALAHSPYLAYLGRSQTAAQADVESKRSAYWPALSARVEKIAGSNPDTRGLMLVESQFGAGLSASSNVDSAQASLRALTFQQASAARELRSQVQQQWSTYVEARKRHDNTAETSRSAWSVYESYVRLYTISQKSWLDVLNQLREAITADLNEESASAEVSKSALQLLLLTGKLPDGKFDTGKTEIASTSPVTASPAATTAAAAR